MKYIIRIIIFLLSFLLCFCSIKKNQSVDEALSRVADEQRSVGRGPAGILKGKIDSKILHASRVGYFESSYGLGVELVWETRLLTFLLVPTERGGVPSIDVMQAFPDILLQDKGMVSKRINSGWRIKRWEVFDKNSGVQIK